MQKSSFEELVNTDVPVLVDFFATWCGPCQMMAPVLSQVKESLGEGVSIIKVDVDKNPALAQRFQIQGVPTFMLFKKGASLWRQSGMMSKHDLIQKITPHL
jgi:thioredoxin 1